MTIALERPSAAPRWVMSWAVAAVTAVSASPGAWAQASGLTLAEVVRLRQQGVSEERILSSARQYCVAFALDDSARRLLGSGGADSGFMQQLAGVCRSAPPTQAAPIALVDDDLDRPSSVDALLWDDRTCAMRPEQGGLRLDDTSPRNACLVSYRAGALRGDMRIQVQVAGLGASSRAIALLGFALQDDGGELSLSVSGDNRLELCRAERTLCNRLFYAEHISAIHDWRTATNELAVEVRGREVSIVINGQPVGSYVSDRDLSGGISFGVGPGSSLRFGGLRAVALVPRVGKR